MFRLLLVTTTTGYQTAAFVAAGARLGVEVIIASDRCHVLDDPWGDQALPIRFEQPDAAAERIAAHGREHGVAGVVALGDRATTIAAEAARQLGLRSNAPAAVERARNKHLARQAFRSAGLATPEFLRFPLEADERQAAWQVRYPCVLKPLVLSASRGVIRADSAPEFVAAFDRIRRLLRRPEVQRLRDEAAAYIQVETFIPGREYALEGLLRCGQLEMLALFDKPDPLDGPYFEETIYTTPSRAADDEQQRIRRCVQQAVAALGLEHGPIHAEVRVNANDVYALEVAARPIGGLCSRTLRFERAGEERAISLEGLLLRDALGEDVSGWRRESQAAGVMMIPIARAGVLSEVAGVADAERVAGIETVEITAKLDQPLEPLPEAASYLGFIFARAATAAAAERALREAHACLRFTIGAALPVVV